MTLAETRSRHSKGCAYCGGFAVGGDSRCSGCGAPRAEAPSSRCYDMQSSALANAPFKHQLGLLNQAAAANSNRLADYGGPPRGLFGGLFGL